VLAAAASQQLSEEKEQPKLSITKTFFAILFGSLRSLNAGFRILQQ